MSQESLGGAAEDGGIRSQEHQFADALAPLDFGDRIHFHSFHEEETPTFLELIVSSCLYEFIQDATVELQTQARLRS